MSNPSPFFVGFHRRLFGRKPLSGVRKCLDQTAIADQLCGQQPVALFGQFIDAKLLDFKATSGTNSHSRIFSVPVTFWPFLGQVLDSGSSCRKAVCRVQTLFSHKALQPTADADTASLQKKYPQPSSQKPGCGFPLMNILGLFDLAQWCLAGLRAKGHADNHDLPLFRRLYRRLHKGDTVVADRAFCSWFDMAILRAKGVDVVMRLHQARKVDFRTGRRLGKGDHLVVWKRPPRKPWMSMEQYATMPQEMILRVIVSERVRPG